MTDHIQHILMSEDTEFYVKTMEPSDIVELGTPSWFEFHERFQKLHQQAILEARELREETVKEMIVTYNKMTVVVHEAVCVSVWREQVLPILLHITPQPKSVVVPYMVLFHEATAVEFLETLLFHADGCEALGDASIELLDYAACAVAALLADTQEQGPQQDLRQKQLSLYFNIGIKCICILSCIAQNLDSLPASAASRMFATHDVPILLVNIIERKPWFKQDPSGVTFKFEDCRWQQVKGTEVTKVIKAEAHTWFALRHLLLDPRCPAQYEINDYRKNQILKLQCFLHDTLLDQLSPLLDMKWWLTRLVTANPPAMRTPVLLQVVPEIRTALMEKHCKRWKKIAKKQAELMFGEDKAVTQSLHETYNLDVLEALSLGPQMCVACGEPATNKCSRCKAAYCTRQCQVKDWSRHKPSCDFSAGQVKNCHAGCSNSILHK